MAVVVIQTFEGTVDEYNQVNERLDPQNDVPSGLIVHCGADIGGGKIRVVDLWESEADFQSFLQERLMPAVKEVNPDSRPADVEIHEALDVVKP